jgi:hypothetical protein
LIFYGFIFVLFCVEVEMNAYIIAVTVFIGLMFLVGSTKTASVFNPWASKADMNFTWIEEVLQSRRTESCFLVKVISVSGWYKDRPVSFSFNMNTTDNASSSVVMKPKIPWCMFDFFSFQTKRLTERTKYYRSDNGMRYVPEAFGSGAAFLGAQVLSKKTIIDILDELAAACEILERTHGSATTNS